MSSLDEQLAEAVEDNDFEKTAELIAAGADVNAVPEYDSILYLAVWARAISSTQKENKLKIARLLLEKGADLESVDASAVTRRGLEHLQLFMEFGLKPDLSCLNSALESKDLAIVTFLLSQGIDNADITDGEENPYNYCRHHKDLEFVNFLAQKGIDPKAGENNILIHNAASAGNSELIRWLVGQDIDVNSTDTGGTTAPFHAAFNDNLDALKALVALGADLKHTNKDGNTVVHEAVQYSSYDCLEYILAQGADPAAKNKNGKTPLNFAAELKDSKAKGILNKFAPA